MNENLVELQRQINKLKKRVNDLETMENGMAHTYGYVGGAWQKDPLRLGYSAQVARTISNTSLAAGATTVDDTAVPVGEIWEMHVIAIQYTGTVSGVVIQALVVNGTTSQPVLEQRAITSGQWYIWTGKLIMKEGDYLRLAISGATLNDDGSLRAMGMRVDIDL